MLVESYIGKLVSVLDTDLSGYVRDVWETEEGYTVAVVQDIMDLDQIVEIVCYPEDLQIESVH